MAKGTPSKIQRNKHLVDMKKTNTFKNLAKIFNISEARAKEIYYREIKGGKPSPTDIVGGVDKDKKKE